MVEEAVPVVGLRGVVPRPVRRLRVGEDDADALVLLLRVAPDVEVALGRSGRRAPRRLEPGMLIRRVVDDELGDDADAALVRLVDEALEVLDRAVARMDALVVGDVVAVVAQRRRIEGQEPQRVDAEPLQVVELAGQPGKVADAVVVAVEEGADVRLVDDRVLVPVTGHVDGRLRIAALKTGEGRTAMMCATAYLGIEAHVVPLAAPQCRSRPTADRAPRRRSSSWQLPRRPAAA